jgi:hypothetical protein
MLKKYNLLGGEVATLVTEHRKEQLVSKPLFSGTDFSMVSGIVSGVSEMVLSFRVFRNRIGIIKPLRRFETFARVKRIKSTGSFMSISYPIYFFLAPTCSG